MEPLSTTDKRPSVSRSITSQKSMKKSKMAMPQTVQAIKAKTQQGPKIEPDVDTSAFVTHEELE